MENNNINNGEFEIPVDIDKEVNVLQDNKQTTIRIPKEIVDFFDIKKGDKFRFIVELPENEEPKKKFEIIKNDS